MPPAKSALPAIMTKLAAARTRLIMERPFLGSLVMHLPLKEAGDWCKTTATDAQVTQYANQVLSISSRQAYQTFTANGTISNGVLVPAS